MAEGRMTMERRIIKVVRLNKSDPSPWRPSDLPFSVLNEYVSEAGEQMLTIYPFGTRNENIKDKAHYIPTSHTAPHEWKTLTTPPHTTQGE